MKKKSAVILVASVLVAGILAVSLPVVGLLVWGFSNAKKMDSVAVALKSEAASHHPRESTGATDLKLIVIGGESAVLQGAETDFQMSVIRRSENIDDAPVFHTDPGSAASLVLAGNFQGDIKLASEIVKGGKGLTVQFDPETVKGSDDTSKLKINADADADLGAVAVKLTATIPDGRTISRSVTVVVNKK